MPELPHSVTSKLPETGFVRLAQIIGDKKRDIPPLLPISKTTWWKGIHEGRFPKPIKIGPRVSVWLVEDIKALMDAMARDKAA